MDLKIIYYAFKDFIKLPLKDKYELVTGLLVITYLTYEWTIVGCEYMPLEEYLNKRLGIK